MRAKTSTISTNKEVSVLERYIQVIPDELLKALKDSANENGLSLEIEIAARLTAYMAEPELAKENTLSQQILCREFSKEEAFAECKRKRDDAHFVYEMEKLRLFLRFEKKLPRHMKESFLVINVKEATASIKKELALEEAQDRDIE